MDVGQMDDDQEEDCQIDAVQGFVVVLGAADEWAVLLLDDLQTIAVLISVDQTTADWAILGRAGNCTEYNQVGHIKVYPVKTDLLKTCSSAAIQVYPSCRSGNLP